MPPSPESIDQSDSPLCATSYRSKYESIPCKSGDDLPDKSLSFIDSYTPRLYEEESLSSLDMESDTIKQKKIVINDLKSNTKRAPALLQSPVSKQCDKMTTTQQKTYAPVKLDTPPLTPPTQYQPGSSKISKAARTRRNSVCYSESDSTLINPIDIQCNASEKYSKLISNSLDDSASISTTYGHKTSSSFSGIASKSATTSTSSSNVKRSRSMSMQLPPPPLCLITQQNMISKDKATENNGNSSISTLKSFDFVFNTNDLTDNEIKSISSTDSLRYPLTQSVSPINVQNPNQTELEEQITTDLKVKPISAENCSRGSSSESTQNFNKPFSSNKDSRHFKDIDFRIQQNTYKQVDLNEHGKKPYCSNSKELSSIKDDDSFLEARHLDFETDYRPQELSPLAVLSTTSTTITTATGTLTLSNKDRTRLKYVLNPDTKSTFKLLPPFSENSSSLSPSEDQKSTTLTKSSKATFQKLQSSAKKDIEDNNLSMDIFNRERFADSESLKQASDYHSIEDTRPKNLPNENINIDEISQNKHILDDIERPSSSNQVKKVNNSTLLETMSLSTSLERSPQNRHNYDNLQDLKDVPCEPFPLIPGSERKFLFSFIFFELTLMPTWFIEMLSRFGKSSRLDSLIVPNVLKQ